MVEKVDTLILEINGLKVQILLGVKVLLYFNFKYVIDFKSTFS